ncbi:hypothetical protein LINPERHAP2_LOCUS14877 [Linum perenne]
MIKFAYEQDYFRALTGGPWVLTSLGNLIGKTVRIDFNTQRAERVKFARIAVEIDLSEPLLPVVLLDGVHQLVEYENMPTICFECGRIGHDSNQCPHKVVVGQPPSLEANDLRSSATASSPPASAPDQYGPWMLVSRRSRRPNKATRPIKEGHDQRKDSTSSSGADLSGKKERKMGDLRRK